MLDTDVNLDNVVFSGMINAIINATETVWLVFFNHNGSL
jgi:hypothetical protein